MLLGTSAHFTSYSVSIEQLTVYLVSPLLKIYMLTLAQKLYKMLVSIYIYKKIKIDLVEVHKNNAEKL